MPNPAPRRVCIGLRARSLARLAALFVVASSTVLAQTAANFDPFGSGPIQLRGPTLQQAVSPTQGTSQTPSTLSGSPLPQQAPSATAPAPAPEVALGEFEKFVGLPRFGAELVGELGASASDYNPVVPPEYIVQSGDELQVTVWGSVDSEMRLTVDRGGRITIPRVGPVMVAGQRYGDLDSVLTRRVAQVFKNFELSVSLGRLRGVRVYVTGFVQKPGAYAVVSLSTVMNAVVRAGGPSSAGSFRQIELRRGGKLVGTFDLYDLLLRGDRSGDRLVQPDDVIHVPSIGPQVALRGSVNKQAIYELRPGETLRELLGMAGGQNPVADRSRVLLERLDQRNALRAVQLKLPADETAALMNGDVVRVFSAVDASLSVERQNRTVRVDGEVAVPGEYVLPPGSTLLDALQAAGGTTASAYPYGTVFSRESVRVEQQENYERALRNVESDAARASTQRVSTGEESAMAARSSATSRLIERLRTLKPTGRVVLQLGDDGRLPSMLLENGDRLRIPARPTAVGVFGSVFNPGSYLYIEGRNLGQYLRLAGGPTKGADDGSIFVVRASGQVTSSRQGSSWMGGGTQVSDLPAEPGDSVFVPEDLDKTSFIQFAKDWTQILFQFGLGIGGLKSALN